MGGYAPTEPTVYVVAWRDAGVVKNGYSERQRWRKFVLRGAEVLALYAFPRDSHAAFMLEADLFDAAVARYPKAFDEKCDEAQALLGPDCGGYVECFRADADEWARALTEQCPSSNAQASERAMPRGIHTNERTYGLTQSMAENRRSPDLP